MTLSTFLLSHFLVLIELGISAIETNRLSAAGINVKLSGKDALQFSRRKGNVIEVSTVFLSTDNESAFIGIENK